MSTTITSRDRLIDILSLSYLGDLLRERLGDDAESYVWPDDFEEAVADIGFSAVSVRGQSSPYDELIVIGNGLELLPRCPPNGANASQYKSVRFIAFNGTKIPQNVFNRQTALQNFVIPTGVTTVETAAFQDCTALVSIVFPNTLTSLSSSAFRGCTKLVSVSLPDSVNTVYASCFYNCTGLKSASLPGLTAVNDSLFSGCTNLETVQFGSIGRGIVSFDSRAFTSCTQSSLVVTFYSSNEGQLNTVLANIRNRATGATIIAKAAAGMTYNGTTYQAGDTVVTSTP